MSDLSDYVPICFAVRDAIDTKRALDELGDPRHADPAEYGIAFCAVLDAEQRVRELRGPDAPPPTPHDFAALDKLLALDEDES